MGNSNGSGGQSINPAGAVSSFGGGYSAGNKGIGGGLTDMVYGSREADAAQAAAMAQQAEARRQYDQYRKDTGAAIKRGIKDSRAATTQGILQLEQDLKRQEGNLARQEQLIAQIDPTIIEASQQALKLLRGEQSSTLAPLQRQRDMQRNKLLNSLREQLGPGAETSTAGIQALNRFDAETDTLFAGAQQSALQGLGNLSAQFTSQRPDIMREIMGMNQFGQQRTALGLGQADREVGWKFARANGTMPFGQNLMGTAGAQYTRDAIMGAQNTSRTNAWADSSMRFGESMAGFGMAGGGGGGQPTSSNETAGTQYAMNYNNRYGSTT